MSLPPCHSRRVLESEPHLMFCVHPGVHVRDQVVDEVLCGLCTRWRDPPPAEFQLLPAVPARRQAACSHLGAEVGRRECKTCRGLVMVKVFACRHPAHGTTTLTQCQDCPDFREAGAAA